MPLIADYVLDAALSKLSTEANRLDICSSEPTSYAQATSSVTLGNKALPSVSPPTDRSGGGRKVTVAAISGGSVTSTGTASHYALTDTINSRLLAAGPLGSSAEVTSGGTFSLDAFDIGVPDAS